MTKAFEDEINDLAARVDRSKRYHQRRRAFFDTVHKLSMLLIIVFGSAAASAVFGDPTWLALLTVFLAAIDLVYAPSHKARDHEMLFRRFSEVDADLSGVSTGDADRLAEIYRRILAIESDEPPVMCALERSCWNEVAQARGHRDQILPLRLHQRLLMHLWRFEDLPGPPGRRL